MRSEPNETSADDRPEGRYANYFEVGHNAFEFVLDFGQSYVNGGPARVHTRIVASPTHALLLLRTLSQAIERYERAFSEIERA